MANVTANENTNKNVLLNDNDDSINNVDNNIDVIKTVSEIDNDKVPYVFFLKYIDIHIKCLLFVFVCVYTISL